MVGPVLARRAVGVCPPDGRYCNGIYLLLWGASQCPDWLNTSVCHACW